MDAQLGGRAGVTGPMLSLGASPPGPEGGAAPQNWLAGICRCVRPTHIPAACYPAAVLHLGGDFGNLNLMLRPAGCSKKSQKIRGCQRKTNGISGNLGGLQIICTIFQSIKIGKNRHLKTTMMLR